MAKGKKAKKIGATPNKVFKTEVQVFEQLLKKIELGRKLSEIEFQICSPELKAIYLQELASNGDIADPFILDFCDQKIIEECVAGAMNRGISVSRGVFDKIQDEELIREYLENKLECDNLILEYELDKVGSDFVKNYYQSQLDNEDSDEIWLSNAHFNLLDEKFKIIYILKQGLWNLEKEIVDWFNLWKKAKGRELRIEQILTD